jgi:hypothetical protein
VSINSAIIILVVASTPLGCGLETPQLLYSTISVEQVETMEGCESLAKSIMGSNNSIAACFTIKTGDKE